MITVSEHAKERVLSLMKEGNIVPDSIIRVGVEGAKLSI